MFCRKIEKQAAEGDDSDSTFVFANDELVAWYRVREMMGSHVIHRVVYRARQVIRHIL